MVTVLMATYQGKQYLEQQLDTILAQTVPVKILISDDGSDDGTREMLENYAGWYPEQVFLHHRTEHTGGAAGNFFWLMQEALKDEKNEYIFFSDQDDVWENNKVSVMLHRMKVLEKGLGSSARSCYIRIWKWWMKSFTRSARALRLTPIRIRTATVLRNFWWRTR